jgi:diaminopimelate decarboxylase
MTPSPLASFSYVNDALSVNTGGQWQPVQAFIKKSHTKPIYFYNLDDIERRTQALKQAFKNRLHIHYAMKANDHQQILKVFKSLGCGGDIVSGGELKKALDAQIPASQIVFSGVGKTKAEITAALVVGVGQINIESPEELIRMGELARAGGYKISVAFRLNPDVNPQTHPYIKTGFRENKFGMDLSFFEELKSILARFEDSLSLVGVTMHIGSQLRELSALFEAVDKSLSIWDSLKFQGYPMRTFDIGGGIGIDYQSLDPSQEFAMLEEYGAGILARVGDRDLELHSEPGRILVARSGVLITEVQYLKKTPYKNFLIVDAGMHQLLRPSLYQAFHQILPLQLPNANQTAELFDVVGPICESADVLGTNRVLAGVRSGDLLAVMDTGAYGAVMSSDYNSQPRFAEIFVSQGRVVYENH